MSRLSLTSPYCLFLLSEIADIHLSSDDKPDMLHTHTYTLIAVTQGNGSAIVDGQRRRLLLGSCFMIPPHTILVTAAESGNKLRMYRLAFQVIPVESDAVPLGNTEQGLPLYSELSTQPFGQLKAMLRELHRHQNATDELTRFKQQIRLQEILYELYRQNDTQDLQIQSKEAVRRSIDLLHQEGGAQTSVNLLARQANIGVRQYTYLFKQLTGQSPLDYITELKINHAKRLLLISNDSLQQVAHYTGFKDVYYFSRRFKQIVGQSPKQYVSNTRREIRIVAFYYANVLISIGMLPIAANLTWWGGSYFLREQEEKIEDIGSTLSLEAISKLMPDLIIMNDSNLDDYASLSKIAPTVMIPYDSRRNIYEDTRLIGELVNKPHAANELQSRFEQLALEARRRLSSIVSLQPMAAIVRFEREGSRFSIFGDNYGRSGWPIYHGLQFRIPESIQEQLMDSGIQILQDIPLEKLPTYTENADFLFIIDEEEGTKYIAENPIWINLPAVKQGRVYVLDFERFSYFDPLSIEGQLELLTQMLLGEHK
ncbi:helix-turn-helix domain-containing protein [Cohnella abietis]|uniref:HTH-type transcriptional activator Btr n=1 Tax=Cohnella abietis TaxID=2507935 RepID=A0A3T1CY00_9BACL|nr:helix-turn-helix domain-containing protein [Cohnella abietis]BBI30716.1 hypothetical protein KCTCHS21_01150 [Cohnella abietis]